MPAVTTIDVTPGAGALGASVRGVDLGTPLAAAVLDEIRASLDEHMVLFFPDQHLDDAQHLAFALQFGAPYIHPIARQGGTTVAACEHIVDDVDHPPFQDRWHTDVSWDHTPPTYGTLRAIDLPPRGGDTIWANMVAAHESLSPPMQEFASSLEALHTLGSSTAFVTKAGAEIVAEVAKAFPGTAHPVVGTHPSTGRRYLAVNREFTESIVGLAPDESRVLLDLLTARATDPNLQVRHSWTVGDVAIWDERCTQHFAVADYMPFRREMGRVAVV